MNDVVTVLAGAAKLIRSGGHVKRLDAADENGRSVLPHDERARRWNATGAMIASGRPIDGRAFLDALVAFGRAIGINDYEPVREWDWSSMPVRTRELCKRIWEWEERPQRTAAHVLAAFTRAIELPEEDV